MEEKLAASDLVAKLLDGLGEEVGHDQVVPLDPAVGPDDLAKSGRNWALVRTNVIGIRVFWQYQLFTACAWWFNQHY